MTNKYESWGRFPKVNQTVVPLHWRCDALPAPAGQTLLPYGLGRSYGDSCLNGGNAVLATRGLNRFIQFDREHGVIRCEAGVSFAEILELIVPHGWFLPVTPGTKFVTVGGAVANDVHGKNHHAAGSFGNWVNKFELLQSGGRVVCSLNTNEELFRATIGGLGLTGLITWVEFRLIPISTDHIYFETEPFVSLKQFLDLSSRHAAEFPYLVAWIDSLAWKNGKGRGVFIRGKHASGDSETPRRPGPAPKLSVPFDFPSFTLNHWSVAAFNKLYYWRNSFGVRAGTVHYDPFFYPLDAVAHWNRFYGKRGLVQWQGVVPFDSAREVLPELMRRTAASGFGSFLSVMKVMGDIPSLGKLSFPRQGVTLALDFPAGDGVFILLERLDSIVADCGGAIYPAKDARMSAEHFERFYPEWRQFQPHVDPNFSSSFWRRVTVSPIRTAQKQLEKLEKKESEVPCHSAY